MVNHLDKPRIVDYFINTHDLWALNLLTPVHGSGEVHSPDRRVYISGHDGEADRGQEEQEGLPARVIFLSGRPGPCDAGAIRGAGGGKRP